MAEVRNELPYMRYHFKRFRYGKEMAEGASAEARTEAEALKIVQGWYSYADSFWLHRITQASIPRGSTNDASDVT